MVFGGAAVSRRRRWKFHFPTYDEIGLFLWFFNRMFIGFRSPKTATAFYVFYHPTNSAMTERDFLPDG